MYNSQTPSPQLGKSTYSSATRRDILWNVVEPGDPYDIRKSMIAKLPRGQQYFMGDNLQIVCLLQSAQIERLCQFLDDYRFRYREIQRRQLDRHSYQVQIKQLTQQLADEGSLRIQNGKLKDFIKKQTMEIQDLKNNRFNVDNNLRANYESALAQIQSLMNQNNFLKSEKENYILQINNYSVRIQALESARERELKELFNRYANENKISVQNETRTIKTKYESEINRLEFEIKRLKEFNETKNQEINQLTTKNRNLILELEELNRKKGGHDPAYVEQMEERFALLGQEIQRLNLRIKESIVKIDESARNELYWKDKFTRIEEDYKHLEIRYKESTQQYTSIKVQFEKLQASTSNTVQIGGLEEQIERLKAEIRRLQQERVTQSQRYSLLQKQYNQLEYNYTKISVIERENTQMKASQANSQELKRKIAQYETKIALLSQEVQRLTYLNKNSSLDKQGYDDLRSQYEDLKRKSIDNERSITQKYETEIQRRVLEYESKLAKYAQESGNQFQIRLQAINRQVERLNQYLKQKSQQSEFNKRRIRELENSINEKYQVEVKRQNASYELTIKQLRTQIENMSRKYRDNDAFNKKFAEYENTIALLNQEIERLNFTIKARSDEIDNLNRKVRQLQLRPSSNIADFELNRKISVYEETQFKLARQNEDLRRRLQEIVELNRRIKQYEDRIRMLTQQNDRINMNLREKLEALNRSETNLRIITQEVQALRKNRQELQLSYSQRIQFDKMENSRKFTNYQQSLSSIQRQYEDLRRKMMDVGNDNNRKIIEYENRIVLLTQEIERVNQTYKLKINQYENVIQNIRAELETSRRQYRELQISITQKYEMETSRKVSIYEQNITGLNRQLEELRRRINQYQNSLRKKTQEVNQLENRYRIISQQYQSYKFQMKSYEGEVNRSYSTFEQNFQKITRDYEELKRVAVQYENKIALISQQNQRLNSIIKNNQQDQENLRRTINELKIEITQKYELEASRKANAYEQNISALNREREEYRRKIMEYENLINNLNRELQDRNRKLVDSENKLRQLQIAITQKYEVESIRKIQIYQQNIQSLGREMENLRLNYEKQINRINGLLKNSEQINKNQALQLEQLRRRLKEFGDVQRMIVEYENQFALIRQELERVNLNLKSKVEEVNILDNKLRVSLQQNEQLRRKIKEVEISIVNKYNLEFSQKSTTYEQNLGNFRRENDDLKRKIAEFENKIVLITQQVQRLNGVLRVKVEELNQSQLRGRNWQQQIKGARRKLVELQKNTSQRFQTEITRTVSVYEQNMANLAREYEQYRRQSSRKIAQYEAKIALLSQELERTSQGLRLRTQDLEKMQRALRQLEMNSVKRLDNEKTTIISTYEQNMTLVTRQYEEYKLETSRKISQYQRKIMQMTQELEMARRQMKDNELAFNQKYELEVSRKTSVYESNFTTMKNQLEDYDRKIKELNRSVIEYQNKIALMNQQIERLNSVLKTKVEQAKHYQNEVQKYILQLENVKSNLSGYYATQIQKLNGIIRQKNEQYQILQQKISQMQVGQDSQYKQLQSSYSLVSNQYENSKKHLIEYEQSIRKLYSEFQRLQVIINELKMQRQTLFDKNHGLIKEVQRLAAQNKDQQTQIYQLRLKFSDEVSLQKRINEHMALMVVLFAEIQTLRERVKTKQKEVKEVRRSSLAPLRA